MQFFVLVELLWSKANRIIKQILILNTFLPDEVSVMWNHTVNALLLNFCKFDPKKSRENANCSVMISKLYCNTVLKSLQYS